MESELSSLKLRSEQSDIEVSRLKSLELSQKTEIDSLRSEISILHSELKENTDETVNCESQHRNEVRYASHISSILHLYNKMCH